MFGKEKSFEEVMDEYGSIEELAGRVLVKLTIQGEMMDSRNVDTDTEFEFDEWTEKAVGGRNVPDVIVEREERSFSDAVQQQYGSVEELAARVLSKLTFRNGEEETQSYTL